MRAPIVMLLLSGCGPTFTYLPKEVHALRSLRPCSQGPLDIEVKAVGAARGEQLEVYACSAHAIGGRYALSVEGSTLSEGRYGSDAPDNQRCRASVLEAAREAGPAASGGRTPGPGGKAERSAPAEAPASHERLLEEVAWSAPSGGCRETTPNGGVSYTWSSSHACGCGLQETSITSMEWVDDVAAPLRAGGSLRLRLWSVEPNDLEGVTFVARLSALDPSTSQKRWLAARRKERDEAVTASAAPPPAPRDPAEPTTPPPAARAESPTPRPSVHAEWIPGYWHFGDAAWGWIPGWWRVPDADVASGLTTRAPSAPPALRAESAPPATFGGAVWIPGQWQWSGRGWVWVAGAWRLPPARGLRWRAADWRVGGGGAVLVPGGWIPGAY